MQAVDQGSAVDFPLVSPNIKDSDEGIYAVLDRPVHG